MSTFSKTLLENVKNRDASVGGGGNRKPLDVNGMNNDNRNNGVTDASAPSPSLTPSYNTATKAVKGDKGYKGGTGGTGFLPPI